MTPSPLEALTAHLSQTAALEDVAGLLAWDQETCMPPKGAAQRARQSGAMAAVLHARRSDPRIPDWIAAIDRAALSPEARRNVDEAEREHAQATRVPARLAEERAAAASEGHQIWAAAREARDVAAFLPALARNVALARETAACLAELGSDPYDALLDHYEPGSRAADLDGLLGGLRAPLVALAQAISERPVPPALEGSFPAAAQTALATRVAERFGYDMAAGRIDLVAHPFCSGSGGDVRITTRVDPKTPLDCLYSTIHETGHALYAQGLPSPSEPWAEHASMGVHESQSRFWENQIARSAPFMTWLWPEMQAAFGAMGIDGPEALARSVNRVVPGYIRTEADEVHYNLHILMRFDLERALICGDLLPGDLEAAWNDRFAADFGRAVPEAAQGCLQDVHWAAGLFGYFPTYALGNIYAGCLDAAMRRDLPDRDESVAQAETGPILAWLRARIHAKGRLLPAPALIEAASGAPPTADPLIAYLQAKFSALYDLPGLAPTV